MEGSLAWDVDVGCIYDFFAFFSGLVDIVANDVLGPILKNFLSITYGSRFWCMICVTYLLRLHVHSVVLWYHLPIIIAPPIFIVSTFCDCTYLLLWHLPTYLLLLHLPTYLPIVVAPTYCYCTYLPTYCYCTYLHTYPFLLYLSWLHYLLLLWLYKNLCKLVWCKFLHINLRMYLRLWF